MYIKSLTHINHQNSQREREREMKMRMRMVGVACGLVAISSLLSFATSSSPAESLVYVGCTQLRYAPGSPYEWSMNSVLASLVNSASLSNFNHFKSGDVYGLFQCRGDLTTSDCRPCVATAVSRIGTYCAGTTGGALQLDACFIKYDNTSFVGAQDKSVMYSKCGAAAAVAVDPERDAVLAYLSGGGQYMRVGGSGKVQGMAQCEQDLSVEQCGECLAEAVQRLRTECDATSAGGDMFLGKCYARFSLSPSHFISESENDDNDETEKALALIIGAIAAVTLLIIFLSFSTKCSDTKDGK